jgi:hypothetical protein
LAYVSCRFFAASAQRTKETDKIDHKSEMPKQEHREAGGSESKPKGHGLRDFTEGDRGATEQVPLLPTTHPQSHRQQGNPHEGGVEMHFNERRKPPSA